MTRCAYGDCPNESVSDRLLPSAGRAFGFCRDHEPQTLPLSGERRHALTRELAEILRNLHEGLSLAEPEGLRDGDFWLLRGALESAAQKIGETLGRAPAGHTCVVLGPCDGRCPGARAR